MLNTATMVDLDRRETLECNFDQLECPPSDWNVASKEAKLSLRVPLFGAMFWGKKQTKTERQPSRQHTLVLSSLIEPIYLVTLGKSY